MSDSWNVFFWNHVKSSKSILSDTYEYEITPEVDLEHSRTLPDALGTWLGAFRKIMFFHVFSKISFPVFHLALDFSAPRFFPELILRHNRAKYIFRVLLKS